MSHDFKVGDIVFMDGEKWVIKMIICARIYIRNKSGELKVPRFNEVKPIITIKAGLK